MRYIVIALTEKKLIYIYRNVIFAVLTMKKTFENYNQEIILTEFNSQLYNGIHNPQKIIIIRPSPATHKYYNEMLIQTIMK